LNVSLGSIIDLTLMQRKQLLYRLLTLQDNEIEICPTRVIRCNGEFVSGERYFSTKNPIVEFGHAAADLDSTQATIEGKIKHLQVLDKQRMLGRSSGEISRMRARAMEGFYVQMVEENKFEGLVVKDLASPYIMGERKYWWKFKPDYESGEAVDIDVSMQCNLGCISTCRCYQCRQKNLLIIPFRSLYLAPSLLRDSGTEELRQVILWE
jgi:hypothetical protein